MLNVDETAVLSDMPPTRSWEGNGRKDAHIIGLNKHAGCMTAMLTVRADVVKELQKTTEKSP
ncbi:hypothetical protein PPTG_20801 [Phytophthora nicotianae INRA-310]|uniref:DDE-1 domain-containing protein n=1 Tax=Phytophthora nicotianae (strain INRA-310) TaxID=761204 RepID=W2RJ03_PHYN3|nr:hypothetical protein PPTG_20801 [Phytophthora nicotianae INRA-310]ETN24634.1 hypothetical protein PPTG_20801 [Phytophthora nicotianae INRA-310]